MKNFIRLFTIWTIMLILSIFSIGSIIYQTTPDKLKINNQSDIKINSVIPVNTKNLNANDLFTQAGLSNNKGRTFETNLMLMKTIPIKTIDVEVVDNTFLQPCGTPFGIKMFTQGIVVVGISDIKYGNKLANPARDAGLKIGDIILAVNQQLVNTNEELADEIQKSHGEKLHLLVKREESEFETDLLPINFDDDKNIYKAGLWVRDSSAGLGTLTYYDPQSSLFGGLGHGICDVDTGELLPLLNGDIVSANISGIVKGNKGAPGELKGYFLNDESIGSLQSNNQAGVYGIMKQAPQLELPALKAAFKQDISIGPAKILTTIDGNKPQFYDIKIENVNYNTNTPTKNMIIRITDSELLQKTGGIIQGMSGSPIIQNNMLVGAVTHVFINEPEKGYGIFIENMLEASENTTDFKQNVKNNAA